MVIHNCIPALPIFMGLLGYRLSCMFALGDKVGVVYGNPSYIVSGLPKDVPDAASPMSRTNTSFGHGGLSQVPGFGQAHTYPNDLFDGEFEISNLMGMAMVFLTNMITIKAGDRAKIEVGLLNDMVRVVSNEFRHHSALGDEWVFDDGRLSGELNYTSYRHESHGRQTRKELLADLADNKPEFDNINDANDTGIWRMSRYIGWLGDFIHMFVTDPQKLVADQFSATIGNENWRSGRSHIWAGNDGSVLVQSVGDIVLERVIRVLVPRRIKRHDDPEGQQPDDFDNLESKWLKQWKDTDPNRPWEKAFQLRQYGRWLSQYHGLARFRQAVDDWEVPTESQVPGPSFDGGETDVGQANAGMEWGDAYATIRIYRDGSIGLQETEGATVTMAHGSIWLAATRHLWLEAAGDVRIVAGQNIFLKARRSIELVATVGGLILKARTKLKALCERGSIWFKSDAYDPDKPETVPYTPVEGDPEPEILPAAVLIQADNGQVEVCSKRRLWLHTTGEPDDDDDDDLSTSVVLGSSQHVLVDAKKNMSIKALTTVKIKSDKLLGKVGTTLWYSPTLFDINGVLTVRNGKVHAGAVVANTVDTLRRLSGIRRGPRPPEDQDGNPIPGAPAGTTHLNHISVVDTDKVELEVSTPDERRDVTGMIMPVPPAGSQILRWAFQPASEYLWDADEKNNMSYVSPSQQTMKLLNPDAVGQDWAWASDRLLAAPHTDSSTQSFGGTMRFRTHTGGTLLTGLAGEPVAEVSPSSSWTNGNMSFRFLPYPS